MGLNCEFEFKRKRIWRWSMRKKIVLVCVLFIASVGLASPFVNPPETGWWPFWQTPFPYQRNIYFDFHIDPQNATFLRTGSPGADYEGTGDSLIKQNDTFTYSSTIQWIDTLGIEGAPTGLLGIDNRLGTSTVEGTIAFRIGNYVCDNPVKHVWVEFQAGYSGTEATFWQSVSASGTVTDGPDAIQDASNWPPPLGRSFRRVRSFEIRPNPSYEIYFLGMRALPGQLIVIDNLHIATECVPEPATISLFSLCTIILLRQCKHRK